jgi:hypothetical protein
VRPLRAIGEVLCNYNMLREANLSSTAPIIGDMPCNYARVAVANFVFGWSLLFSCVGFTGGDIFGTIVFRGVHRHDSSPHSTNNIALIFRSKSTICIPRPPCPANTAPQNIILTSSSTARCVCRHVGNVSDATSVSSHLGGVAFGIVRRVDWPATLYQGSDFRNGW